MSNGNKPKSPPGGGGTDFGERVYPPGHKTLDETVRKDQGVMNTRPIPPEPPPKQDQNKK